MTSLLQNGVVSGSWFVFLVGVGHDGVVAFDYLPVDRDQQYLLPSDMREWLPRGIWSGSL